MNSPCPGTGSESLRQLILSIPLINGTGQVHTVVRDESGNLYLSDEFNHSVISLSGDGTLRWRIGEKGHGQAQFWYPRGLAVGWTLVDKKARRCLAACDTWNSRVQVFDLSGLHLHSWHTAGGRAFNEAGDIRYLSDGAATPGGGCWLVLDRNNHRLCALGADGRFLFETGRALPLHLESRGQITCLEPEEDFLPAGIAHDFPAFDALYYPTRILGRAETALYLLDSSGTRLKQPLFGSFFPLSIVPPDNGEWVDAADDTLLAWNAVTRKVSWLDAQGEVLCEASVDGKPIGFDLHWNEIWLQCGERLELWQFESAVRPVRGPAGASPFRALLASTGEALKRASPDTGVAYADLLAALEPCLAECDELLGVAGGGVPDPAVIKSYQDRAVSARGRIVEFRDAVARRLHELWMSALKIRLLAQSCPHQEIQRRLQSLHASFKAATQPIDTAIARTVHRLDQSLLWRLDLLASGQDDSVVAAAAALDDLERVLLDIIRELRLWSGTHFYTTDLLALPCGDKGQGRTEDVSGGWIRRPAVRKGPPISRYLREVDRYDAFDKDAGINPNPLCIARTSQGDYFVTLFSRGTVFRLSPDRKASTELLLTESGTGTLSGPAGIAVDAQDRLWIVEFLSRKVSIYDPKTGETSRVVTSPALPDLLLEPIGIAPGPNGSMLVADSRKHCVFAIRDAGTATVFCGRPGSEPGELLRPISLCISAREAGSGFWVVDQRNHRLQRFDAFGRFTQQIGRCGPGRGSFLAPQYGAQFFDGLLAVTQNQIDRCLKLFSSDGEELDCMILDFMPAGALTDGNRLLVAEWSGRSVRMYERIQ